MSLAAPAPVFRERLTPGPGLLAAAVFAGVLALVVLLPAWPTAAWALGAVTAVACLAALALTAPVVSVSDGVLRAGRARVPVALLGEVDVVADRERRTAELGPHLDARAYVVLRSSVPTAVKVALVDPADPTPYWLISSRRPEELAAAIDAARRGPAA